MSILYKKGVTLMQNIIDTITHLMGRVWSNDYVHNLLIFSIATTIFRIFIKGIVKLVIFVVLIIVVLYFLNKYGIL